MTVVDIATVNLSHLQAISDDTGVLQFTFFGVPDPKSGYTTDDNARALIVAAMHYTLTGDEDSLELAQRYLAFLRYVQRDDGWFHNLVGYDRRFLDEIGSEDCFGRSLWALGTVLSSDLPEPMRKAALAMWERSLPNAAKLQHPRPKAYSLVGIHEGSKALNGNCPSLLGLARQLADDLCNLYIEHSDRNWKWFGDEMTYSNGVLCDGLLRAYLMTNERRYLVIGLEGLQFLNEVCWDDEKNCVSLVGNRGWYRKGGVKPDFAQQPVDAMWLCWANLTALQITGDEKFHKMAKASVEWFFGRNIVDAQLYDPETGACHDGLEPHGANENCGAESTICALLTLLRWSQKL
ncbi:MAG: glycosyltransferase [Armatimonadetes bacterium]|nr:glycosyltransferase [Armatimonadota bacterium]MDW8029213.1 glycosyltransferase [Armatimonadota bacterium]